MITKDDAELARAAVEITKNDKVAAIRLLRDECGWSLRQADNALRIVAPQLYDRR